MRSNARVGVCAGLLCCAAGASAGDGDGAANAGQQQLTEVVVTAQKMQQTLEQVPASVSALDGEFMRQTGARNYDELQNYTANTNLQVSSSSTQLLIRGFGTLNDVPGLDPSVGVVVDGVVYTYPEYLSAFFGDLNRYEVLRGPQGTLFGKNVTAGLLNITTNPPDPDERLFQSELDLRSYGNRAFRPVINLPLGDGAAVRFSGNFEHGDHGLLYNTDLKRPEYNPQQDSGRVRFRYDSHDGWTMDIGAFVSYHDENFNKQQLYLVKAPMLALDRRYDPQFTAKIDGLVSEDVPATENATTRGLSVTFDGDLGHPGGMQSLKLTSITSVAENIIGARDIDADFSPVPFIRDSLAHAEPEAQVTQELRVGAVAPDVFGFGHQASFVAGLYYDNYTLDTSDDFIIEDPQAAICYELAANGLNVGALPPGTACSSGLAGSPSLAKLLQTLEGVIPEQHAVSGVALRTKDYAAFGNAEWFFTQQWALLLGLRYAKENRTGQAHSQSDSVFIQQIAHQQNFNDTGPNALRRTETDFSPKAGLKYQPSKHTEAYLTWAKGYKSGGFNGIPLNPQSIEYGPEQASSFETGFKIKDRLWGGPIRGSISLYRTHFGNLQVSTFQGTNPIVVNAAAARSQGFEADALWLLPVRGLSLHTSFGLADARYTFYPNGLQTGDGHCPAGAGSKPGTCNLTGQRLPFAPDWTAALTPTYTLHLPLAVSASAALDLLYQGSRYLNSEDDPRQLQQATLVINPRLIFADDANGDWGLTLGIQNFTKQTYSDQIIDQPLAPGDFAAIRTDRGRFYTADFYIGFH